MGWRDFKSPSFTNQTYMTSVSGPYTVVMNPAGSCVPITKTLNVVITPAPQLFASIIQAGCSSTAALATCTAAGSASVNPTIIWSPTPFALANSSTQATYLPPGTATVLTVTATDNNNCPVTKTVSLLPAPPAVTFSVINTSLSTSITCANPVVTLSASTSYTYGALSYSWTSTTFTSASNTASITQAQTVQATAWDPLTGCSTSTIISIPINTTAPTSTVTPTSQTIACGSNAVQTLTSVVTNTNSGYTHCWFAPGATVPVCNTGTISLFVIGAPGITSVVVTNPANGCTTVKTVTLINSVGVPLFTVTSTSNFSIGCAPSKNTSTLNFVNATTSPTLGVPVSYTVLPPGFTGTYSIPNGGAITSTVVTIPGTYTVIIKDQLNNCESRVNVPIIQNTVAPSSAISVSNTSVNSFALNCITPNIVALGSSTVANAVIAWVLPTSTVVPQSSIAISVTSNTATTSLGTYSLRVEDPNNGCISFNPFPVTQSIQPPIPIITNSNTPNVITCRGIPVALKNSSTPGVAGGVAIAVSWAGPSPQLPAGAITQYNGFVAGVYSLTVRNSVNGCTATGTLNVGDNLIPPIYPSTIPTFILDCSSPSIRIGVAPTNSTSTFQYNWTAEDPGNLQGITPTSSTGSPFTNVTKAGEYRVDVVNPLNGCTTSQTFQVLPGDLNVGFTTSPINGFAPLTVSFVNTSASSGTIAPTASITSNWNFGNGSAIVTTTTNISQSTIYNSPGTYTVVLNAQKGSCVGTATQVITVDIASKLTVPNVFTPNGDGANDKFKLLTQNLTNIEATIFDRWGNIVFETTSDKGNIEWDGMNLYGKESANGTYFYVIKADGKDGKEYTEKGTISLYR
jgi:gliding motility-associated-like protein